MTTDQPDSPQSKAAGRGVDLFFGEGEAKDVGEAAAEGIEAAQTAAEDVVDAVASKESVQEAADAVQESAVEAADAVQETAAEAVDAAETASGQAAEAQHEAKAPAAPVAVFNAPPPPSMPPDQPVVIQQAAPQKSNGCLWGALGAFFGGLLGVVLTLGLLLITNQGLSYAPRSTVNSLQATVTAYERGAANLRGDLSTLQGGLSGAQGQVSELQQGLAGLESAVETQGQSQGALAENVTGIAGQVRTLEDQVLPTLQDDVLGLQESVDGVSGAVDVVASDVATLTQRVDTVSTSAERAQRFLAGMQELLAAVLSDDTPAATPAPTATLPLTATAPLTATPAISPPATITATPTITATAPLTPELQAPLTATLEITATATPTPTLAPDATPTPVGGVIRGVVFLDNDRNGVRDPETEQGIANVRVTLYTQNRTELARTTTNLQGEFEFTGLNPGIYVVVETDQPGFASSTPNVLTAVLRSSRPVENVNFGNYRP